MASEPIIDVPGHLQAILSEVRSLQQQQRVIVAAIDSLGGLLDAKTPPTAAETLQANGEVWNCLHRHAASLAQMEVRLRALEESLATVREPPAPAEAP